MLVPNVCTKKIYEDCAEVSLLISSISFVINVNETGKFSRFRRKATSQGVIKTVFWGRDR